VSICTNKHVLGRNKLCKQRNDGSPTERRLPEQKIAVDTWENVVGTNERQLFAVANTARTRTCKESGFAIVWRGAHCDVFPILKSSVWDATVSRGHFLGRLTMLKPGVNLALTLSISCVGYCSPLV